jgi:ribose 5-phosphate isomerase RpiB
VKDEEHKGVGVRFQMNYIAEGTDAVDTFCAHPCVEHDDVNLLCMGAWVIGIKLAEEVLRAYLNARFSTDEGFRRRVRKLEGLENFRPS